MREREREKWGGKEKKRKTENAAGTTNKVVLKFSLAPYSIGICFRTNSENYYLNFGTIASE